MQRNSIFDSLILGCCLIGGLALFGYLLGNGALRYKAMERCVTVKGLSEREVPADVVIWPITFTEAGNDLGQLYQGIEASQQRIIDFLLSKGIDQAEISQAMPSITDKSAQQYSSSGSAEFRYVASQTVTVYSTKVDQVRAAMTGLTELGRHGLVLRGQDDYQNQIEYLFTGLNDLKPEMVEEATAKAREVAEKFAKDSQSRLGRIRTASQGQFSIDPRDRNTPYIKKIRVVSTVEYYLAD